MSMYQFWIKAATDEAAARRKATEVVIPNGMLIPLSGRAYLVDGAQTVLARDVGEHTQNGFLLDPDPPSWIDVLFYVLPWFGWGIALVLLLSRLFAITAVI